MALSVLILFSCSENAIIEPDIETEILKNKVSNQSNEVTFQWSQIYLSIEKDLTGFRPAGTCRALAHIHLAAYETSVSGMPNFVSNTKFINSLSIPQAPDAESINWNIALNENYYRTLGHFLKGKSEAHKNLIDRKYEELLAKYSNKINPTQIEISQKWGESVATAVINYSKTDLEAEAQMDNPRPSSYDIPVGPGLWIPTDAANKTALFPYWGKTRTFTTYGPELLSKTPTSFSEVIGSPYYNEFREVDDAIKNLTYKDRWIAEFWSDDIVGLTFSPPARQFAIADQIITNDKLNLETTLHLYLKLGLSMNDAAVAAWGSKYYYNVERPDSYIKKYINSEFKTILGEAINVPGLTPPFPGYPSGHSTFGAAGAGVFIDFFGDNYSFTDLCHKGRTEFNGKPRIYLKFSEMAAENAYSRIPLGVHPRMDCVEGLRLGYLVANNVNRYKLRKA